MPFNSPRAARSVALVIPELEGRLDGFAIRVPTPNVSMVDFSLLLQKKCTVADINNAMKKAALGELKGILNYADCELVGQDYVGARESAIFDSTLTMTNGKHAKVVAWYDNEVGFSNRVIDLAAYIGEKI